MKYTLLRGTTNAVSGRRWLGVPAIRFFLFLCLMHAAASNAQISSSEQINMPGAWNGWQNPGTNLALMNGAQNAGGRIQRITVGQSRYQAQFSAAASGGDVVGGVDIEWVFSSGPTGNLWGNKWCNQNVQMNTLQNYTWQSNTNNKVTLTNGKWYTVNYIDNGYVSTTQGIVMETSAQPVTINTLSQSPLNGSVNNLDPVDVTITTSASPSAEEIVYLRYTTDNFVTSNLVPFSFVGNTGTAQIPGQGFSTIVSYYVFSTTVVNPPTSDVDKVTINFKNANPGNFTYSVNSALPPVNVTFEVNMSYQSVSGTVYLAGSFNGWSPSAMTNAGGGIWTKTIALDQGASYSYKFVNGSTWESGIPSGCVDGGGNRTVSVGNAPQTVGPVCFNSCGNCNSSAQVTFQVNLTGLTVSNPQLNGAFLNGWASPVSLTSIGNGIYATTVTIEQGSAFEYKFINGGVYEGNISAPCGNGSNRIVGPIEGSTATLPVVCFNSCTDCTPRRAVTFRVNMNTSSVSGVGVRLAGSFGGAGYANWDPNGIALTDANSDGIYDVTLNLPENTSYEYKFINGNSWGSAENVPGACNSNGNRALSVGTTNQLLPVVCFGSCTNCPTAPGNDYYLGAQPMITPNYPSMINSTGTLALCTVSPETSYYPAQPGAGQDAWFRFKVPSTSTGRMRIQVTSTNDVAIILQKVETFAPYYSAVAQTNDVTGGGTEIMNTGALTPDTWYRIAVKNMGLDAPTTFTIGVSNIRGVACASGSTSPKSLCDAFSVSYTGASSYTYTFTDASNPSESYTKTVSGSPYASSTVFLSTLQGLRYGRVYNVVVDATYTLTNGSGSPSIVTLTGSSNVCQLTTTAQPLVELSVADRCANSTKIKSSIISTAWVCGVIDYVWSVTPVQGLQTEYLTTRGAADRFIRVGNLNGINSGATQFNVRVKPVFSDGAGGRREGDWGAVNMMCLSAPITMATAKGDNGLMDVSERSMQQTKAGLSIYPNPTDGSFVRLSIDEVATPTVQVAVMDITGRVVYAKTFSTSGSLNVDITEMSNAAAGVYVLRTVYNGKTHEHRLVISE